jgi:hypothetical protein
VLTVVLLRFDVGVDMGLESTRLQTVNQSVDPVCNLALTCIDIGLMRFAGHRFDAVRGVT